MKKMFITKIIILTIFFYNLIKTSIQNEICSASANCENCNKCEIVENADNLCEYGNLFCKDKKNIIFFSDLKSSYKNYFDKNQDFTSICGVENIYINTPKSIKILELGNKNKKDLINIPFHCYYNINASYGKDYTLYIIFSLNSQSSENVPNNKLSFSLYFNFANKNNFWFTDNDLRNSQRHFQLNGINTFSIMADINKINNDIDIGEYLLIEINIQLNSNYNNRTQSPKGENEESSSSSNSVKDYTIYYIIGGCIAGVIVVIIIIIKNCMKRQLYLQRDQNQLNNLNGPEVNIYVGQQPQIIIRKKIELLFKTKLYPRKYSTNIMKENTGCSICLGKFENQKSLICLTVCNHIFHYECLKQWGEEQTEEFKCPNCKFDFLKEDEPIIINVATKKENNNNNTINNNLNSDNFRMMTNRNNNIETLRSNANINIMYNFG